MSAALAELKQGNALKRAGKCEEALLWLRDSFHLDPKPRALLYVAECDARLGDFMAAASDASDGARLALAAQDEDSATAASTLLDGIETRVAHLTVTLAHGSPLDCTISLDQIPMAASIRGVAVRVNPGRHVIAVAAKGRADQRFDVFISEGASARVEVSSGEPLAMHDVPASAEASAATDEQ
jgi:hypothetical protein